MKSSDGSESGTGQSGQKASVEAGSPGDIERLQSEITRLRDICRDYAEIVQSCMQEIKRLSLTSKEREAIRVAASDFADNDMDAGCWQIAATLRGLLERHCPTPENQPQQDNTQQAHSTTAEGRVRFEWIPVGERLPDHGGTVVCRTASRQLQFGRVMTVRKYDGGEFAETYCWMGYPDGHLDVTHWFPLPEPPPCVVCSTAQTFKKIDSLRGAPNINAK